MTYTTSIKWLKKVSSGDSHESMNRKQRRAAKKQTAPAMHGASQSNQKQQILAEAVRHHQAGQLNEAERLYRQILALDSRHADSLHLLGVIAYQVGRYDSAIELITRAIAIDPAAAAYHSNLGNALKEQGKLSEAVAHYRQAIALKSDYPEAHNNLGNALLEQGRLEEAIASCRTAIALKPDYADAHNNLGIALREIGRFSEAVASSRTAVALRPDYPNAHNNLGNALQQLGRLDEAIVCYRKALDFRPGFADAYNNIANALIALGRLSEARDHLKRAIELSRASPAFYWNLGMTKRFTADDPDLAEMQQMAGDIAALGTNDKIHLHFALGKALADIGQHEQSFFHLLRANTLKRQQIDYDEGPTLALFERIRNVFTPELMRAKSGLGHPSTVPIFIVGMPRSGTTLVEQILASHHQVFGAGELSEFENALARVDEGSTVPFPERVRSLSGGDLRQLGMNYLDAIAALAPGKARIVDKMPPNFRFAGLIHLALPNARIIHIRRDPRDNCVSCFATLFATGPLYSYDLSELGRYYRAYQALMQHWREVLPPAAMLEVRYEALVDDFEPNARRIVAHCELDWDDACLAFHQTQRPVQTASATQVRQPIYRTSVGRWEKLGSQLAPLLQALGQAA